MPHTHRVRPRLSPEDRVSIIIPTNGTGDLVRQCIDSLRYATAHTNIEIVCIDNIRDPTSPLKRWLRQYADRVVECLEDFNWSRFNNLGAAAASGDYLLFLNDDIEVIQDGWLEAMLEALQAPGVGIVGPQLLYPNRRVQHAGLFLGRDGVARHAFRHCAADDPGYFGLALTPRDVIAVTGAALLTRRATLEALGGFDETHRVVFNDVDFCFRARAAGLVSVFTPHAKLIHHEMASRRDLDEHYDRDAFAQRWHGLWLRGDPYFNPRLDKNSDVLRPEAEPVRTEYGRRPAFDAAAVRRILVIKVDHIGDFVTALPAIRRLKAAFPNAALTAVVAPASRSLAALEEAIDRTITFGFFHAQSQQGQRQLRAEDYKALTDQFAGEPFDLAVDLRKHPETRQLLRLADAKIRAGFDFRNRFPWLDVALEWAGNEPRVAVRQHIADDLRNLVDAILMAGNRDGEAIARHDDWTAQRAAATAHLEPSGLFARRVICVHPAAGAIMRQWSPERFADLIETLLGEEDVNVGLISGPGEETIIARVLEGIGPSDRVFPLLGDLHVSLQQLPYFLDRCALFVGNDSGPKHIAAGLGVPTVAVHAGVVDAIEFAPLGNQAVAIKRAVTCAPCYLSRPGDCPRALACLDGIGVADVIGAVTGPKVVSVKYRRRKGFHKKIGHRQKYTEVKITSINA